MTIPAEGVLCSTLGCCRSLLLLAAAMCLAATGRASLITITPTFDTTITSDPHAAAIESTINAAINYYDTTFTTGFSPLTVNITFQENNSPGSLGSSLTNVFKVSYSSFISALHTASSGDVTDTTALAGLPITSANPVNGSTNINLTSANCRAVGLGCTLPAGTADSTISVNTSITTPPGSSTNSNLYSLFAVTEHEIDEVLGLGSDANNPASANPFFNDPLPMDLFRYGPNAAGAITRVYNTPAGFDSAYFSIDGKTFLVQFNNNATGAGGDYGDWWSNNGGCNPPGGNPLPRVQDAFAYPGTNPTLATDPGTPEIIALDAIGYNLNHLATPEPTTMLMVGSGLLVAVLLKRRRSA